MEMAASPSRAFEAGDLSGLVSFEMQDQFQAANGEVRLRLRVQRIPSTFGCNKQEIAVFLHDFGGMA